MWRRWIDSIGPWFASGDKVSPTGRRGEDHAVSVLQSAGLKVVERNWRCTAGELDVVCMDRGALVFVEVKSSLKVGAVPPEGRVGPAKRQKLRILAQSYMKNRKLHLPVRFDVVAVWWEDGNPKARHIVNAF